LIQTIAWHCIVSGMATLTMWVFIRLGMFR